MNINVIQTEIHQNAKEHGWWEGARESLEIMGLVVGEASELNEALRDEQGADVQCDKPVQLTCREEETADIFIRVCDYSEYIGMSNEDYTKSINMVAVKSMMSKMSEGAQVGYIIKRITSAFDIKFSFKPILAVCEVYADIHGFNLDKAVTLKHLYNKTRPYKHGKQF